MSGYRSANEDASHSRLTSPRQIPLYFSETTQNFTLEQLASAYRRFDIITCNLLCCHPQHNSNCGLPGLQHYKPAGKPHVIRELPSDPLSSLAGIMNIPLCDGLASKSHWNPVYWACLSMQRLLHWGANMPWVRDHVVQAQYFRVDYLLTHPLLRGDSLSP